MTTDDVARTTSGLPVEPVLLDDLKPHPHNYREHTDEQLAHLAASLREHGVYRPVVIARDSTILAGHGLVGAARALGFDVLPCVRLDVEPDDPRALRVLVGDNEIAHLVERDDRRLSELLRELDAIDAAALLGTGYDRDALDRLLADAAGEPAVPEHSDWSEPSLQSECLIEIRCTRRDLDDFQNVLDEWGDRPGVSIDVS